MTDIIQLEMPTLREVLKEVDGNEEHLKMLSHKLRLWLNQQLYLPQDISEQRLRFIISNSKFDSEKAKKRLDLHYTIRNLYPEIANLDPLCDKVNQCYECLQMIAMPKLTPQKYRLFISRVLNPDPAMFDVATVCKCIFLLLEILAEEDIINSDVLILDASGLRVGHILKLTPSVLKKAEICLESYGRRIKAIYIINAPNFIDTFMSVVKSVIKLKIFNRMHLHTSGIESLYKVLPKSILPADYGGEQPSMNKIAAMWQQKLIARRKWFLEQEKARVNESLRIDSVINPKDLFGAPGIFQKLEID